MVAVEHWEVVHEMHRAAQPVAVVPPVGMPTAGLTLDEGWRVEIKQRSTGNSAGTKDAVRLLLALHKTLVHTHIILPVLLFTRRQALSLKTRGM